MPSWSAWCPPLHYTARIESRRWLILTALRSEAKAIARALRIRVGQACAVGASVVEIQVIGIGAARLSAGLVGVEPPRGIIMAGFGGALDPSLCIGDVVVDGRMDESDGGAFQCGHIHTAGELVLTVAMKAALFRETGARVVDMEGEKARALAASSGVPFIHVRAISDAATDSLDPAILRFVDEVGNVQIGLLILGVLRRPGLVAHLARLGKNSRRAARHLGEVVAHLVASCET
jgi:adenosylhomocysteine nucleosidase